MRKFIAFFPSLALLWVTSVAAHGPVRQKVEEKITIHAPAPRVWQAVREFCSLKQWHPMIADCIQEGELKKGSKRKLILKNGGFIVDELKNYDEQKMAYAYKVDDMSSAKTIVHASQEVAVPVLPVANFAGSLEVKGSGQSTEVIWKGAFYRAYMNNNPPAEMNEEAAVKSVTEFFKIGLDSLKRRLESP